MSGAPLDIIERLPEWRGAACTELAGGLTNRAWHLEKDGRRAVLKIDDHERRPPLSSRAAEAAVQSAAASAGLAGEVLHADSGFYLTTYIEGAVWDRDVLAETDNLHRLALALRRLHALPLTGHRFDPLAAATNYLQEMPLPKQPLTKLCLDVIAKAPLPESLCCCHNDLVAENIVSTPALFFIDWEYACDNDPMFDLATIIEHHDLGPAKAATLLAAYCDGDDSAWQAPLNAQRRLYLALLWLWLASRPGSSAHELNTIGERLLTSCS